MWSMALRLSLEVRMHDRAVVGQQRALDDLVVPIDRQLFLFLVDQGLDEGQQIPGVKRRSRGRHPSRHVEMADDLDPARLRNLAGLRALDIPTALDREIDD